MSTQAGWHIADVNEIPPVKPDWPATWKSVRAHFGITAFGINAVTKDAGKVLIPEHHEQESGQEEVYFVHRGSDRGALDGEVHEAPQGAVIAVGPKVTRKLEASASPNTLLVSGVTPG